MTDLHTHILPGADDGAHDLAEALAMARTAQADGVSRIVATPHIPFCALSREALETQFQTLQEFLTGSHVDVELSLGAEISLEPDILQWLADGFARPLGSSRYVLVELPFFGYPPYTEELTFRLQVEGYKPILAHPERNSELAASPSRLGTLAERGVLVQVTTTSLLGGFGLQVRNAAEEFLRRGWAHVLASDGHSANHRPPTLTEGIEAAEKIIGEGAWDMVTTIPAAILHDRDDIDAPRVAPKGRRWLG